MNESPLHSTSGSVPVPDPTLLTTQALMREIGALKELIFTRLDANDEALAVARDNYTRVPTDIDKAIGPLRELLNAKLEAVDNRFNGLIELIDQRFKSAGDQFAERDLRAKQSETNSKEAVAAALQAAKEAVGEQNKNFATSIEKSDAATTKQLEGIERVGQAGRESQQLMINDLKDRMTRLESLANGRSEQKTEQYTSNSQMWMVIGGILGIGGFIMAGVSMAVVLSK